MPYPTIICVFDTVSEKITSTFIREEYPDQKPLSTQIYIPCPSLLVESVKKDENGEWVFTKNLELERIYWEKLRTKRNTLLASSDWTRLDDVQCDKQSWAAYRQSLRDLPSTVTDPTNVTWPVPPS